MNEEERIKLIKNAHQKSVKAEGGFIGELFSVSQADVLDEVEHLDSLDREEKVDFDADENEVDMNLVSPNMKGVYEG
tara:strand:+ start:315 stop:545 length:231 start_codon:yes stop_codon:yes gene_type:complete